jgi:hypothetical protein
VSERWRADQLHAERQARRAARHDAVRRLNDASLEHLIALLRYSSMFNALFAVGALIGKWWWPAMVAGAYALTAGWVGWWYFGNSTWRKGK